MPASEVPVAVVVVAVCRPGSGASSPACIAGIAVSSGLSNGRGPVPLPVGAGLHCIAWVTLPVSAGILRAAFLVPVLTTLGERPPLRMIFVCPVCIALVCRSGEWFLAMLFSSLCLPLVHFV